MQSGEDKRRTDARWSFALGILLGLGVMWVAYEEISALPTDSHHGARLSFFGFGLVGVIAGVAVVLRSRLRHNPQEQQRHMGIWWKLVVPLGGILLLFEQFAPPLVKIPVYALLAGGTLALMIGFWVRMRGLEGRRGRPLSG